MSNSKIELIPVKEIPEIKEGDNLSELLLKALKSQQLDLENKDIELIIE